MFMTVYTARNEYLVVVFIVSKRDDGDYCRLLPRCSNWPCGATDNASDYGSEDSRFESWQDACLRCQAESSQGRSQDCVVVWGECNHSFHYCCMSLWVKQNNRCPLCQQEWSIQRMGK
ncbi:RING finger, putative [Pediculus humanus corporis]|uniref:RING finger, putative n=1 Tax=Pediculus humanus subsp. corporis TaxID=121224 RepID=E0W469_PEDHC|nr:RING finger, putative [Pediculus humanus corporis]EEB20425.1 RING finger, putative [Pediculus humanus corporis]